MPGYKHVVLAHCRQRLSVLQAEHRTLIDGMKSAEEKLDGFIKAVEQNRTDQAQEVQRIAELEAEIKYWHRND